jgi:hypothetical protein
VVRAAARLVNGGLSVTAETFYRPVRRGGYPLFRRPLAVRHPNTGEPIHETVEERLRTAALSAAEVLTEIDTWLTAGSVESTGNAAAAAGRPGPPPDRRGPSLEFGCDTERFPEMRFVDASRPVAELLGA